MLLQQSNTSFIPLQSVCQKRHLFISDSSPEFKYSNIHIFSLKRQDHPNKHANTCF